MMTKEEKTRLKEKLPLKWSVIISERTGLSESYVRRVMSGLASHVDIEKKALELARDYQDKVNEVEQLKESIL